MFFVMKKIEQLDIHRQLGKFRVFMFNVGQGDHFLLQLPNGEYGIIDFHYVKTKTVVEAPCLSYFKSLKTKLSEEEFRKVTIAFVCISHTDNDHIKGLMETITWFHDTGVFIREFWLSAARDEMQLRHLLKGKIKSVISKASFVDKLAVSDFFEKFTGEIKSFYDYFDKWRKRKFKSLRYQSERETLGCGEYLVDIRSLMKPFDGNCAAVNIGPLGKHVDTFLKSMTMDLIKNILCIPNPNSSTDKNLLSHILLIRYGQSSIIFGGDTHKEIWEESLLQYHSSAYQHLETFGPLDARFVKVSHHGSKNSSSQLIWQQCLAKSGKVVFGISAGQNLKYNHPDSETLSDIRTVKKMDALLFSTNICKGCVLAGDIENEEHVWYDEYVKSNLNDGKTTGLSRNSLIVNQVTTSLSRKRAVSEKLGLLAYIFEIPDSAEEEIKVRAALSKSASQYEGCFYKQHSAKLCEQCC